MKPVRNPAYLKFIRQQHCAVRTCLHWTIEAAHTGPRGLGQKSSDLSAIPLCAFHHRTGPYSYHRLGRVKFCEKHGIDIPALIEQYNAEAKALGVIQEEVAA